MAQREARRELSLTYLLSIVAVPSEGLCVAAFVCYELAASFTGPAPASSDLDTIKKRLGM